MKEVYGVTGMPLSGKTTVADMLEEEGFEPVDMGDVVREKMREQGYEVGSEEGEFVEHQREKHGMDAIARLTVPYVEEALERSDKVVITGMRGWKEKERFEEELGEDLEVVAVWASRETRKKRREERQRKEDVEGQGFHERDLREIQNGVGKLMALSDRLIRNEDIKKEELRRRLKNNANT